MTKKDKSSIRQKIEIDENVFVGDETRRGVTEGIMKEYRRQQSFDPSSLSEKDKQNYRFFKERMSWSGQILEEFRADVLSDAELAFKHGVHEYAIQELRLFARRFAELKNAQKSPQEKK